MGKKTREEQVELVRAVVGEEYSEMDIIRALHMASDDPAAAVNIIFDTPHHHRRPSPCPTPSSSNNHRRRPSPSPTPSNNDNSRNEGDDKAEQKKSKSSPKAKTPFDESAVEVKPEKDLDRGAKEEVSTSGSSEWWLIGETDISGMSTCKGRVIQSGEELTFSFPPPPSQQGGGGKIAGRSRSLSSCSEIVRFSTAQHGKIGRIPNEWARCLLPLVRQGKIRLQGYCKSASDILSIMDTLL